MSKANIGSVDREKIKQNTPIDWDKIAIRIGIVISFITIIGFLITMAWNMNALVEKVGILEGKMEILQTNETQTTTQR